MPSFLISHDENAGTERLADARSCSLLASAHAGWSLGWSLGWSIAGHGHVVGLRQRK